jgi:hypothetical protein
MNSRWRKQPRWKWWWWWWVCSICADLEKHVAVTPHDRGRSFIQSNFSQVHPLNKNNCDESSGRNVQKDPKLSHLLKTMTHCSCRPEKGAAEKSYIRIWLALSTERSKHSNVRQLWFCMQDFNLILHFPTNCFFQYLGNKLEKKGDANKSSQLERAY